MTRLGRVIALAALAGGCTGDVRESTTKRSSQEMLLLSTAAERAVARIETRVFAARRVHLDAGRLACIDRAYVVDALEQRILEAGGTRAASAAEADCVLEVRAAALGIDDRKYALWFPIPVLPQGLPVPANRPSEVNVSYSRQDGWARLEAFAYDPRGGGLLGSWRGLWGSSFVGLWDDILPTTTIAGTVQAEIR